MSLPSEDQKDQLADVFLGLFNDYSEAKRTHHRQPQHHVDASCLPFHAHNELLGFVTWLIARKSNRYAQTQDQKTRQARQSVDSRKAS
jgi:hypothetical protein